MFLRFAPSDDLRVDQTVEVTPEVYWNAPAVGQHTCFEVLLHCMTCEVRARDECDCVVCKCDLCVNSHPGVFGAYLRPLVDLGFW